MPRGNAAGAERIHTQTARCHRFGFCYSPEDHGPFAEIVAPRGVDLFGGDKRRQLFHLREAGQSFDLLGPFAPSVPGAAGHVYDGATLAQMRQKNRGKGACPKEVDLQDRRFQTRARGQARIVAYPIQRGVGAGHGSMNTVRAVEIK